MSIIFEQRASDSPYVESVTRGWTVESGAPIRPAEIGFHLVFSKWQGRRFPIITGPWTSSGRVTYDAGAEVLWIRLKPGVFLPHLPTRRLIDKETTLPEAAGRSFWLKGAAWQFPDYDNADTFINRLVHDDLLACDTVVTAALQDRPVDVSARTMRHRFLHATGQTQSHIRQFQRAQQALTLLQGGASILDTVYEAGYYDQPHLTRALKHFTGYTPAQIAAPMQPV